jgi:hypothetical protein
VRLTSPTLSGFLRRRRPLGLGGGGRVTQPCAVVVVVVGLAVARRAWRRGNDGVGIAGRREEVVGGDGVGQSGNDKFIWRRGEDKCETLGARDYI